MKEVVLPINSEALISNRYVDKCYRNIERLIIGRENLDEIRSYIHINFNPSLRKVDIVKIELLLYLEEIDLKDESDCFMMNIGTVFKKADKEEISWNSSPKFYQESLLYKIRNNDKKKYVKFDVTCIYKKYILRNTIPIGFALLCFNANAIVAFSSIKTEKKGFIKVYYNDIDKCKEEIKNNKKCLEKSYGQFYSKDGNLIKEGSVWIVPLQKTINNNGIVLNDKNGGIVLNKIGIYKVEYSINCRCNEISTIMLILCGKIIESSELQVGSNEGVTTGHCIISVKEEEAYLNMAICGKKVVALDIGIAANVTIVEI